MHNINEMKLNYKKLEGYGLILILFSFGWQMLETDLSNLSTDGDKYQIHEKIDKIYMITADLYSQSDLNKSGTYTSANFSDIVGNWKYWETLNKEKETVSWQLKWTINIRSLIFIIGSVMLILPKFKTD